MPTITPLRRQAWANRYGGLDLIASEGMTMVPCENCTDTICHGWKLQLTTTLAIAVERTLRAFGYEVSIVDRANGKSAYVGAVATECRVYTAPSFVQLIEAIHAGEQKQ